MKQGSCILGGIIVVIGMLTGATAAESGASTKGKSIYEQHCLACHGGSGKGDGPVGTVLNPKATDFSSSAFKQKPDSELLPLIEDGIKGTAMASWKGTLSEEDRREVLAYIRALNR